jgi:Flp pilus assembly protein TadG
MKHRKAKLPVPSHCTLWSGVLRLIAPRAFLGDRFGGVAEEFALTLPPLLMLLFGIMELGRVLWTQNALNYSVAEAARCASIDTITCNSTTAIESFAAARSGAGFGSGVFSVSTQSCGNQVTASYPTAFDIPFATYSFTLTASACYPK